MLCLLTSILSCSDDYSVIFSNESIQIKHNGAGVQASLCSMSCHCCYIFQLNSDK